MSACVKYTEISIELNFIRDNERTSRIREMDGAPLFLNRVNKLQMTQFLHRMCYTKEHSVFVADKSVPYIFNENARLKIIRLFIIHHQ